MALGFKSICLKGLALAYITALPHAVSSQGQELKIEIHGS